METLNFQAETLAAYHKDNVAYVGLDHFMGIGRAIEQGDRNRSLGCLLQLMFSYVGLDHLVGDGRAVEKTTNLDELCVVL